MRTTRLAPKDFPPKHYPWPSEFKLDKNGKFCGQPVSHWQAMAHRDVVETLVRATDRRGVLASVIHVMVSERLMRIARDLDSALVDELLKEAKRSRVNMGQILGSFMLTAAERKKKLAKDSKKKSKQKPKR